jgi:acyl-CoA synthetase (AMP-forming)/AMP-acid ligase II
LEDTTGVWRPDRVEDHTRRLADQLARRGLAGRRVVIVMANAMAEVIALLSALRAGCLPILAKPFPALRCEQLARQTGAAAVVRPAPAAGPEPRRGEELELAIEELDASVLPLEPPGRLGLATSGTTGFSKVVVHRFDRLLWNASAHAAAVGLNGEERLFVSLPCAHSYALVSQLFAGLLAGCRIRLTSDVEPFPPAHLRQLADWGATCTAFTPRSLIHLLSLVPDLPASLRWATVGSDRFPPHWHEQFRRKASGCSLFITYGFSEAGPRVLTLDPRRCSSAQLAGAGRPLPGIDAELRPAGPSAAELWVKTGSRMEGYLDDPDATGLAFDGDWLRSRDSFRRDEEGVLFFLGRLDDAVTLDGLTFFPTEVERALEAHPRVGAARVGTIVEGDERRILKAWVQVSGEVRGGFATELRSFLVSRLERTMVPQQIEILDVPSLRK